MKIRVCNLAPTQLFLPAPVSLPLKRGQCLVLSIKPQAWESMKKDTTFSRLAAGRKISMEEVMAEAPKAEPKKEAPKAEPKKEAPKAEPKKEAPKADPKKDLKK